MYRSEFEEVARRLGSAIDGVADLSGGYSHLTSLLTLANGPVVVRVGGANPRIEAAVMASPSVVRRKNSRNATTTTMAMAISQSACSRITTSKTMKTWSPPNAGSR